MSTTSEALKLSYGWDGIHKGVVYVLVLNKETSAVAEFKCYIDKLERQLDKWGVYKQNKLHVYITKNDFKNYDGRSDNLFSLHNMVIDIDCKADMATTAKYTLMHSLSYILNKELTARNIPIPCIMHYTGNGLQLGWPFEQASSKLIWPYKIMVCNYSMIIKDILSKAIEQDSNYGCVTVDDVMNKNVVGYRRLFGSYNPEAKKTADAVIQRNTIYTIQELLDPIKENGELKFPDELKIRTNRKSGKNNHNTDDTTTTVSISKWNSFYIQSRKRMVLIESLIVDRNAPTGAETRNNYLFIYYIAAREIYSQEMAQQKVKDLNKLFKRPLESLKYLFKEIDTLYDKGEMYRFTNKYIIEWFNMTEDEQEKYKFRPAMIGDFKKYLKEREEERKLKREQKEKRDTHLVTLYLGGLTQEEVAEEIGCHKNTVANVLKKNDINRKQETIKQVQLLKIEGMTQEEVKKALNIGLRTVQRYWNRAEDEIEPLK